MFMALSSWHSHCESSPGSFDECRTAPSGRWPKTKPDDLGCESACIGCQSLHSPSPHIIITHFTVSRRVEGWVDPVGCMVTYRDGLPTHRRSPILVLTGCDVAQLRWSRPTRYALLSTSNLTCRESSEQDVRGKPQLFQAYTLKTGKIGAPCRSKFFSNKFNI